MASTSAPPANNENLEAELRRLRWRQPLEIYLAYAVTQAVLVALFVATRQPDDTFSVVAVAALFGGTALFAALLLIPSYFLARPLLKWVERGRRENAPELLQELLFSQPRLQSSLFVLPWIGAAIAALIMAEAAGLGNFAAGLNLGTNIAAAFATVAVIRIRVEAQWVPFVPCFFRDGDDPTQLRIARRFTLFRRFLRTYVFASLFPIVIITATVLALTDGETIERQQLRSVTIGLAAVAAILGTVGLRALGTTTLRSVKELQDGTRALDQGSFDASVTVDRADELGDLERAFNEMLAGLRMRDRITDLFERQVGEEVARASIEHGPRLGGGRRTVSALFVDLASFTTMTEKDPAEDVVALLNRVFTVVVTAVAARDGLVNKFEGDAALAIFGAPADDADHAGHAVLAAAEIAARLEDLDFEFGIGVASGEVVAGNVGAKSRYEYTVIGDAVNVAARLEERTREVGHTVLVAGPTAETASNAHPALDAALVSLETVRLRGRAAPVPLYGLEPSFWRGTGS